MSSSLTFMMGEFNAEFPCDRSYIKNHMWAMPMTNGVIRFGFSAYAAKSLAASKAKRQKAACMPQSLARSLQSMMNF